MIGDSHAVGIAAEILQHILGAAEGTFQVDHPVLSKQWAEPSREDLGFAEELQLFGEAELTILEGLPEACDELATEDLTQYRFGQEVVVRRVVYGELLLRRATWHETLLHPFFMLLISNALLVLARHSSGLDCVVFV